MEDNTITRQEATDSNAHDRPAPRIHSPDSSLVADPKTIDELIPFDDKARLVWALVEGVDLTPLYLEIKSVEGHAGRLATDEHIASAHELDRRCVDCDPYKWICGGVPMNYHTLSDFRVDHREWLREQVVTNIAVMRSEGLVSLEILGQDGMRVRAHAGSHSFKTAEQLSQLLEEAEQQWEQLQEEFEQSESLTPRQRGEQQRAARDRIERLKQAQQEVKQVARQREKRKKGDGQTARVSTTDPEARRMKMADGAEYHVDSGSASNQDMESVSRRGVTVFAPVKAVKKKQQRGEDPYAPQRDDTPWVAAWRQRMGTAEAQEKYKRRSKTEWPNATRRNRGLQQLLVRGLKKVKAVVLWYVLVQNLFRMVALRAERVIATA
jgi:transposase